MTPNHCVPGSGALNHRLAMGEHLYIRTQSDIRDEFEQTLSSLDGTHLWKLPLTPTVHFSVMGKTEPLIIELE
nr:DotH/IcmK family type IV secretion protein [Candidatus Hamiltonella defensa]